MANRLFRGLLMAVLTTWLAGCGGMGGDDPVTGITASNFEYGQMATLTLTGNALDNAITVTSDKCSLLSLGNATSPKTRQALCLVSGTGAAFFTVRSSAGYVVYTTTLQIPEPVTAITASNVAFGQQATVTLTGTPQNSAIALKSDKCINISLTTASSTNGSTAPRTATCTVVGTGSVTFNITNSAGTSTLYSSKVASADPAQLSTYNNKYSQKTYVAFPTNGLSNLQLSSTGCDTITLDDGSYANARTATCTLSQTGTVQFDVKRADTTVAQTTSIQVPQPQVTFKTSLGDFVMELNPTAAPITVKNFLSYVNKSPSFYNGTIIHRVEPTGNYVVQGGGFTSGMVAKTGQSDPISLESNNGLKNLKYSVGMARTSLFNSATSQFYVNLRDNTSFDYVNANNPGYAVFGNIVSGTNVIDTIATKPTGTLNGYANVPVTDITVTSATQTQ